MWQVEVTELAQQLPIVITAIANGEEVILTDAEVPVAKLIKLELETMGRVPGSARGLFTMTDDFDEPLDDLFEDVYR